VTENIAGVSLPSLLIVPGAWHEPDHYCPLLDELSDIDVHTVTLTSSGKNPAVLGDMYAINATATDRNSVESIPGTYVICGNDNALPVAVQEVLAERADDVQRLSTSHSPFLSQPAALARLIRRSLARSSTTEF
jgi:hypothetical protein